MKGSAFGMVAGLILMAVSFTVFPTVITGADAILTAVANSTNTYAGMSSVVSIGPTLIFLGILFGGMASFGLGAWSGYKSYKKGS